LASIQDIANAAYRIGESSKNAHLRTVICADALASSSQRLISVVRGSRSGEEAVREVKTAERAVRDSALRLLKLSNVTDEFVKDIQK